MDIILSIKNLKVRFNTEAGKVHAVNGVSFDLAKGESLTFVGESGSGKSVTMQALLQLIDPPGEITGGQVHYGGIDLLHCSQNEIQHVRGRGIALISQDALSALNPGLPIGLQVSEALTARQNIPKSEADYVIVDLLTQVGIPNASRQLGKYIHHFSGVMRQRVLIAIALACQPDILIADSPTTALDVTTQAEIISLLQRFQQQQSMTMIWVTNDLAIAARVAQRVLVMYAGKIVEEAQVGDLFAAPRHPYTIGMLNARRALDGDKSARLYRIPGLPPVLLEEPKGCPFIPRCKYASGRCRLEMSSLLEVAPKHFSACWEHRRFEVDQSAATH